MNGVWIGGFNEEDLSEPFYDMGRQRRLLGDDVILVDWDKLTNTDLVNADYVVAYSYGCAALWRQFAKGYRGPLKKLIVLCGVPRFWWGQLYWGGLWTVPSFVESATCYQITSFPVSLPLSNATRTILGSYVALGDDKITNVDLDGRGLDHVSVQDDPFVKGSIMMDLENLRKNLLEVG